MKKTFTFIHFETSHLVTVTAKHEADAWNELRKIVKDTMDFGVIVN